MLSEDDGDRTLNLLVANKAVAFVASAEVIRKLAIGRAGLIALPFVLRL
jgi:hypothetical protein